MKHNIIAALLICGTGLLSSCLDDFAEQNSKPSDLGTPDIRYLFTQCEASFQPAGYQQWYNGFRYMGTWVQATVPTGGNDVSMNVLSVEGTGGPGFGWQVNEVLRYANDIKYQISLLSAEEQAKYAYVPYLCNPLLVYLGLEDSDMYGSRQYTEAQMARYTNPPLLVPKYDSQKELFDVWLNQLDETISYLTSNTTSKILASQDFIYNDDKNKWLKLTNSLKLRIAARLLSIDKARAIQIVNEAAKSSAGFLSSLEDDFIYNKGKLDNNFNDDVTLNAGSEQFIEFLKENKDPRLFYFFTKNDYNSKVVQGFFDQDASRLPSYILANVDFKTDESGKKTFTGWKGAGEPWVRYYGLPSEIGAGDDLTDDHFDKNGSRFFLEAADKTKKAYTPLAIRNRESIKGGYTYTFPDAPDTPVIQDNRPFGWYGLYFSAGETNLLLAEFKLLGATLPRTAQEYFSDGIEMSARAYDKVASLNHIPYYDMTYSADLFDKSIKLTDDMVTEMMKSPACNLTGEKAKDLEKVYIQQYIHYMMLPNEQYVTSRRSGVPMRNSDLLPWIEFSELGASYLIPRRTYVTAPDRSDISYDVTIKAWEDQGYTYSGTNYNTPAILNAERIWYDKGAPDFGAGPNLQ